MRARKDSLIGAAGLVLLTGSGCGVMFNGGAKVVTVVTTGEPRGAAFVNGGLMAGAANGTSTIVASGAGPAGVVAAAPGRKVKRIEIPTEPDVGAIVCDILCSLTIIGIAAPIVDAQAGALSIPADSVVVTLETDEPADYPTPVYDVFGTIVSGGSGQP